MIEGEKAIRHHPALAGETARQRNLDPRHPGGHHQQPGGARHRTGARPSASGSGTVRAGHQRHPDQHGQPAQQYPPTPPPRPGQPGRQRRHARSERQLRARRCLDDLPRTGQAHDRRQVQRPRPRPGQRRGRGTEKVERSDSQPRTTRFGPASSTKWKRPRLACWSSSRCRWG